MDLTAVCYAGRSGVGRTFANDLKVSVRAARTKIYTAPAPGGETHPGYEYHAA